MKRFYTNKLLKGLILFVSMALLYFLAVTALEYFLWLGSTGRALLFWLFILTLTGLSIWFLVIPALGIFNIKRGLTSFEAAKIIGKHFPEVKDKLLNLLQLTELDSTDELVVAGIQQKAQQLSPIPFTTAVNFKTNLPYLKYIVPSALIIIAVFFTGKTDFFDGYSRVVRYQTAFTPPAPFSYVLNTGSLQVVENSDFPLQVQTVGNVLPDQIEMVLNNRRLALKQSGAQEFVYTFKNVTEDLNFYFTYGNFRSPDYTLKVVRKPYILKTDIFLNYPAYTQKQDESLSGSGNVTVPQGTKVEWRITARNTLVVHYADADSVYDFKKNENYFIFSKPFMRSETYRISSSNDQLQDFEKLQYRVEVIPDLAPVISVRQFVDSLNPDQLYFAGNVSDDYGIKNLKIRYHPEGNPSVKKEINLKVNRGQVGTFNVVFPDSLSLSPGTSYALYFEVTDNDAVNGAKSVQSETFYYHKQTFLQREENLLKQQDKLLDKISDNAIRADKIQQQLEQLNQKQKSKSSLNWNEKQDIKQLLERQKQQEQMMQNFSNDLLKTLSQSSNKDDKFNKQLEKRLEENAAEAKENQALLDELNKIAEKLTDEELNEKLDELSKQSKSRKKSLQQLLELIKNYYVRQKLTQLAQRAEQLSQQQEEAAQSEASQKAVETQKALNEQFNQLQNEFDQLDKDNANLRKPINYQRDKILEKEIDKEQQSAEEQLNKTVASPENKSPQQSDQNRKSAQKKAAQKLKQMSSQMQQNMAAAMGEQLQEDIEVLRQILENLITYSVEQENLMTQTEKLSDKARSFSQIVKNQYFLKENFSHIDDSLFSLSLRRPEFSETINKEIENIYQFTDQSLSELSEYQLYKATSSQQYTLSSANVLADFLSNILSNMQEQMSMSGQQGGNQNSPQLPDIIKMQQGLQQQMSGQMQQQGQKGKAQQEGDQPGQEAEQNGQNGQNETDYGGLLEVLKQQQEINNALKDILQKEGLTDESKSILSQAQQLEEELLMQGYNAEVLEKMKRFQHELLKLEEAVNEQGQDQNRKSRSNLKNYSQPPIELPQLKEYLNQIEILNRQPLPLRPEIQKKVKQYFIQVNDTL